MWRTATIAVGTARGRAAGGGEGGGEGRWLVAIVEQIALVENLSNATEIHSEFEAAIEKLKYISLMQA